MKPTRAGLPTLVLVSLLSLTNCRNLELPSSQGPASVSARVVDPANALSGALPGVRATLEGTSLSAVTDDQGLFKLSNVAPARYTLSLERPATMDGQSPRGLRRVVEVAAGQQLFLGELPLRGTGEIQGKVTLDGHFTGNAGTLVFANGTSFQTLTGDDGSFRLSDLPEGTLTFGALVDGYQPQSLTVEVTAGQVVQARPLDLKPAPARQVTLHGTVEFVGDAAPSLRLRLFPPTSTTPTAELDVGTGDFTLGAVPAGLYRLEVSGGDVRQVRIDGIAAVFDTVELGTLRVYPAVPGDADADGVADGQDDDRDGDGVSNANDAFPDDTSEWRDFDGDGLGDAVDDDDDNDGLTDLEERAFGTDGVLTDPLNVDTDSDGTHDLPDDCRALANADQADADHDGRGDACDADRDGDAVPDDRDNCPATANATQLDTDGDHHGDSCDDDLDGDGVTNLADNCLALANPDQSDLDVDGLGDACDTDADGDGITNSLDLCPAVADPTQADLDRDRLGDACDLDLDGDNVVNPIDNCDHLFNPLQDDLDADRLGDACDADVDGDNVANATDNCPRVWNQDQADDDADRVGNACDPDWLPPVSILPVITSVTPSSGNPGNVVTLVGTNFEPATALNVVDFNGTLANVLTASATQLTVQVPNGATSGVLHVRTRNGSAQSPTAFVIVQPLVISDVQPRLFDAGTPLTVYGNNFDPTPAGNVVRLALVDGGTFLTDGGQTYLTVQAATALTLQLTGPVGGPPLTPLALFVTKFGAPTVSSLPVSVQLMPAPQPPAISSMTPNASLVGGPIVIYGSNFGASSAGASVKFTGPNSTLVTAPINGWTNTQISTQVPAGAVTGPITVTTITGTATTTTLTIDPLNPVVLTENGPTVVLPDAGMSDSDRTYTITGNYLAPLGSLRLGDGTLIPPLDGGTTLGAQFVLPEPWVPGSLVYVRGDGIEAPMSGKLRSGRFTTTQALNPVPEQWYQRADRARYYGSVGKLIYQYDGTTLQQTTDPAFDDGATVTFLESTAQGLVLHTNNGWLNTVNRGRVTPNYSGRYTMMSGTTSPRCECLIGITETYYGVITYMQKQTYDFETGATSAMTQISSQYNFGYSYFGPSLFNPVTNANHFLWRSTIGGSFSMLGQTPSAYFYAGSFPVQPTAGYWTNDDSGATFGGAGGTTFTANGWSVTLPEAAVAAAGLPNKAAAVVIGATRLMIIDLNRRTVSSMPFTPNGVFKGLYKEWDRDELVIRTDNPTATLTRFTIDGP